MKTKRISSTLLASAVLLALAAPAQAVPVYFGSTGAVSGTIHVPGPSNFDTYNAAAPGQASSSSGITIGALPIAFMEATASSFGGASTGAAHAFASAGARTILSPAQGSANAQSSAAATGAFSDVFPLNAAGFAVGTLVRMTFALDVDGSFGGGGSIAGGGILSAANWSVNGFWRATTMVGSNGFEQGQSLFQNSAGVVSITGDGHFGPSVYTVDVLVGDSISVLLRAEASASPSAGAFTHSFDGASASAESAFASDLGSTVGWGGILGLSTLGGIAITDFTAISSGSGFDYAHAFAPVPAVPGVPEPETYALMLAGLGVLGFATRRRKRKVAA